MLANGIKETTVTTGTGTITLAAVTGFARYSAVYVVDDRVSYCIKDGDNREWGVGTVGAANTLARTYVLGTLVAGTYSASLAGTLTPITLATTADVFCGLQDFILPELGLDYLRVPPDPTRMVMPFLGGVHAAMILPHGNNAFNVTLFGTEQAGGGLQGSTVGRSVATTNKFVSSLRTSQESAATAGSGAAFYPTVAQISRGSAANQGGFLLTMRFGVSDAALVSGARMFVGLHSSSGGLSNADQSTIDNVFGLNLDTADTNFNILSRGTAATKADLGASFSRATISNNVHLMTLTLWAPPNASFIGYRLKTEGTSGAEATGVVTATLPANTTMLRPYFWRNNGATAAAVGIDIVDATWFTPS